MTSPQIVVVVGQGETQSRKFYVHESLLSRHSEFFAKALGPEWKDSEGTVRLPDDTPEYFEVFARFVYIGKIFSCVEGDKVSQGKNNEWGRFARCWILADKLLSTTFKDALCDAVCEKVKFTTRFPTGMQETIYPSPATSALLKRLIVNIAVWNWSTKIAEDCPMKEGCGEFFKDLAIRFFSTTEKQRKGTPPFQNPACTYHEHVAAGTACYKTMF